MKDHENHGMRKILILKLYFHHPTMKSLAMNLVLATVTTTTTTITMTKMHTVATEDVVAVDEAAAGMRTKISMMNIVVIEAGVVVADEAAAGTRKKISMMNIVATEDVVAVDEAAAGTRKKIPMMNIVGTDLSLIHI